MAKKDWHRIAGKFWIFLVNRAEIRKPTTYEEIALCGETNALNVTHGLDLIQEYCINKKLPPLTVLVYSKGMKKPGGGYKPQGTLDEDLKKVYEYSWDIPNPFGDDIETELKESTYKTPELKEVVEGIEFGDTGQSSIFFMVQARGILQDKFRKYMLKAYECKCAVCGFDKRDALEAAHIIPWSQKESARMKPQNGILLCANHHKLFDAGVFCIDEHYEICGRIEEKECKISLPCNKQEWPSQESLQWHKKEVYGKKK